MKLDILLSKQLLIFIFSCLIHNFANGEQHMQWSEFSFMLKPSSLGGIGVFAIHDVKAGTHIFTTTFSLRTLKIENVPTDLRMYCIYLNDEECLCPERFDRMELGWFINHSFTPNIARMNIVDPADVANSLKVRALYAIKDIKAGDEILIDYNNLKEPEHLKEDYYRPTEE